MKNFNQIHHHHSTAALVSGSVDAMIWFHK